MQILIVDDHPIMRQGIRELLTRQYSEATVAEAKNAAQMLSQVRQHDWDLLVLDLNLPDKSGLDCLQEVKRMRPRVSILMLSMYAENQFTLPALASGAAGYLSKERAPEELLQVVKIVLAGGRYISAEFSAQFAADFVDGTGKLPHEHLSPREFRVLRLLGSGKTVSEIAGQLFLSRKTVTTYRARILQKMHLKLNAELTEYCLRHGLVRW
jgi:two-component system, NarL family, invasion response regulator UvrY